MKPQYIEIDENGNKFYYSDKAMTKLHREDGPAVERADGRKEWFINDQLHREDGPAFEWTDWGKEWYINGKRHREDGPAFEGANGSKSWYINGKSLTEAEFNNRHSNKEPPFLVTRRFVSESKYNPKYGDERVCKCGHKYYRHFDTYEDMHHVGCKYSGTCNCVGFEEITVKAP